MDLGSVLYSALASSTLYLCFLFLCFVPCDTTSSFHGVFIIRLSSGFFIKCFNEVRFYSFCCIISYVLFCTFIIKIHLIHLIPLSFLIRSIFAKWFPKILKHLFFLFRCNYLHLVHSLTCQIQGGPLRSISIYFKTIYEELFLGTIDFNVNKNCIYNTNLVLLTSWFDHRTEYKFL